MALRLPNRPPSNLWRQSPASALDYEIAQETAAALGRQGRALEAALKALADFDADPAQGTAARRALVAAAADALWQFVVQREACGLRDFAMVLRMYRVPAEVRDRMGAAPARRA
jgi:hypothetical protein